MQRCYFIAPDIQSAARDSSLGLRTGQPEYERWTMTGSDTWPMIDEDRRQRRDDDHSDKWLYRRVASLPPGRPAPSRSSCSSHRADRFLLLQRPARCPDTYPSPNEAPRPEAAP